LREAFAPPFGIVARVAKRVLELVCGMPRVLTAASDMRRLAAVAWTGSAPWIAPALARSAPVGRIIFAPLTEPRPKLAALILLIPPLIRAFRNVFAIPRFAPTPKRPAPAPYQG
jgi:hypothetical protein